MWSQLHHASAHRSGIVSLIRRTGRRVLVVVALIVLVGLVWANSPAPVAIDAYEVTGDGSDLGLFLLSCNGDYDVTTDESDSAVNLLVVDHRSRIHLFTQSCQSAVHVDLDEPLGDRTVIDRSTGQEVTRFA
jgi:hypothetical protein